MRHERQVLRQRKRRGFRVRNRIQSHVLAVLAADGALRRVVEIPIVVDRVTGEATIQQRLAVESGKTQ